MSRPCVGESGDATLFAFPLVFLRIFALERQNFITIKPHHIAVTPRHMIIYTQFILE